MTDKTTQSRKQIKLIVLGTFLVTIGVFIKNCNSDPATQELYDDKAKIAMCWEWQAKKSLAPQEQRLIASVCEKKEDDFKLKYGYKYN